MIRYLLECMAFQLILLLLYDLFLKRETFFHWNRVYLLGTFALSFILPLVHIKALETSWPAPGRTVVSVLPLDPVNLNGTDETAGSFPISWLAGILVIGMGVAAGWLLLKLLYIRRLRKQGTVRHLPGFSLVTMRESDMAFSFFRSIFMGDRIPRKNRSNIIRHELVHIRQWHSLDLLFFEVLRIALWFNPLIYLFQARISEVHEFLADARVAKADKLEQYQDLLSQVFRTDKISFINPFYKSSLIKKRIVMIQKVKSNQLRQVKYLLLIPVMAGMLFYSSCQQEVLNNEADTLKVARIDQLTTEEENSIMERITTLSETQSEWHFVVTDGTSSITFSQTMAGSYILGPNNTKLNAKMEITTNDPDEDLKVFGSTPAQNDPVDLAGDMVPFGLVEEIPVFPGCEDAADQRACFNDKLQEHIRKNFHYPEMAVKQGIQGRVNVMFTIDRTGAITSIKKRGPHPLLENEVERIISRLPDMIPGKMGGKPVNVPFSLPVTFKL